MLARHILARRRFAPIGVAGVAWSCPARHCSSTLKPQSEATEGAKRLLDAAERLQAERELAVDSRQVVFTSGASADHRPRIAAAEAFDIAASALPSPPNLCIMNVSLDHAGMIDAPEVLWHSLCKANGVTPSTVKPNTQHMIGGAVCHQRLGGGYIQVLLGCIPDLQADIFTFDTLLEADEVRVASRPDPFVCLAALDSKITLQYERALASQIRRLTARLGHHCPLIGAVYPPIGAISGGMERKPTTTTNDIEESIFFFDDRVYKSSAAAILLRSAHVRAHRLSVVPSIGVGTARATGIAVEEGLCTIRELDGKRATDLVRDIYCSPELREKRSCKVFLAIQHGDSHIPAPFVGEPREGWVRFMLPEGVEVKENMEVGFVVDDAELDSEVAAGQLIALQKKLSPIYVEKDITIAREGRRNVVASTTAAIHYSHGGLNSMARPDVLSISLGPTNALFSPSVLQRCVGRSCANTGVFCPGQIAAVGGVTSIVPRSSTYCFLEGLA